MHVLFDVDEQGQVQEQGTGKKDVLDMAFSGRLGRFFTALRAVFTGFRGFARGFITVFLRYHQGVENEVGKGDL
jgi:hypothetical protein